MLSLLDNGGFVLQDLNSSNGTFVRERGGWRRVATANLNIGDEVRLGTYTTTVGELLQNAVLTPGRARVERNPETGEIIKQRGER